MAAAIDAGAVRLRLRWQGGRIGGVEVAVARPAAAAVLRGRPADEAVRLLPMLYSICGAAQGVAARLALAAARGQPAAPTVDAAVLAEARREHLWRLLLDWPRALGLPGEETLLVEGRRRLQAEGFSAWARENLPVPGAAVAAALRDAPVAPAAGVAALPSFTAADSLAYWPRLTAEFAAAPTFRGAPAETGPLARHPELAGEPALSARVTARLADLTAPAEPTGLGRADAVAVATGIGRAAVETARGLLLHEIVLDGERVADYVVVAPTEWNFHAEGVLRAWLAGAAAASPAAARELAARAVLALDPCVRCDITVADA